MVRAATLLNGYGTRRAPAALVPLPQLPTPRQVREMIPAYGAARGWGMTGGWYSFACTMTGERSDMPRDYPRMAFGEAAVKAPLLARVWSVAALDLQVLPADKNSARDREIAEGYRHALLRSWLGLPHVVTEIGLSAAIHKHSLCEMPLNPQVETRGKWRGRRMVRAVKAKNPWTYTLTADDFGNLTGVKAAVGGESFPADRFIYYPWLSMYGDLDGIADLQAAHRAWCAKDAAVKLRQFFLDKLSGGMIIARNIEEGKRTQVEAALAQMRGLGYVALEPGQEIEIQRLATSDDATFQAAIDYYDKEMMIAVGGSHLPHKEGVTPNAAGNTAVQRDVSSLAEWKLAADVGYLLTRYAYLWVDENYAGADLPTVKLGGVDPAAIAADVNIAATLHQNGVELSKQELYERSGWSAPADPGDALPPAPAKAPAVQAAGQFADDGGGEWYLEGEDV